MPLWQFFDDFKTNSLMGGVDPIDFNADAIKVALFNATAAPNADTMTFLDDLVGSNEMTETNYTAGGELIGTLDVSESGGVVTFNGDDVSWAQSGTGFPDARFAILYFDTGNELTSPMVAFMDMGVDKSNINGILTLEFAGTGLFTLSG